MSRLADASEDDALVALAPQANSKDLGVEAKGLGEVGRIGESQLTELRNVRVLLEEARALARNLAYHRRARLESTIGQVLDEVDRQIEDLRRERD